MLKIFTKDNGFMDSKVNFVDDNNVVLGYDMHQDCCEYAGWFISDISMPPMEDDDDLRKWEESMKSHPDTMEGWCFDTAFMAVSEGSGYCKSLEDGGMVAFRITNGTDYKYIHIFNSHNGYYSHGFNMVSGKKTLHEGDL